MNRTVNLTKRVQTSRGLRYCPVVLAANGRVRADLVIINGQEERHPEGAYYLEWWEGAKRVRLSVGKDAADASARRLQKEAELNAVNHGVAVAANGKANGPRSVAVAVTEFLDETKLTKKPKTYAAYSTALKYFQECCPKLTLHDIERAWLTSASCAHGLPKPVGKLYFNILDYTGSATRLFADPDFDGEPALITEEQMDDSGKQVEAQVVEEQHTELELEHIAPEISFEDNGRGESPRKYYVDGGAVEIAAHLVYELDGKGKQL